MIRLARVWYNAFACYHHERALDHARRRDRALRKLEQMERAHQRRQTQRDIQKILASRGHVPPKAPPAPLSRHEAPMPRRVAGLDDVH